MTRGSGHREALLEGAIACIQAKGFARTTARDLVAASGTNLASIGYHYGSKEHLLREAVFESFRRWFVPLIEAVGEPGEGDPLERLGESFARLFAGLAEHRPLLVAHFEALTEAQRNDELRRYIAERYDLFRAALVRAFERAGGSSDLDVEAIASLVIAAIDGLTLQYLLDPERLLSVEELMRPLTAGVATASAPRG